MSENSRNFQYLDSLRALAAIGVIIIHVATPALNMNFARHEGFWWIANLFDSAVRFAVPVFLMLSGATLIGKKYNYAEYLKRRFTRVLLPFLFWIVVYWIYRWIVLKPWQQPHNFVDIIYWAGKLFVREGVSKHFWYVYMILAIYFIVPVLSSIISKLNNNILLIFLIVWVVLNFILRNYSMNLYGWTADAWSSKLAGWALHSGYLVLGYYLSQLPIFHKTERLYAMLVFITSIASCAVLTYLFSRQAHKQDLSMYGYLKLNTIIQSVSIFLMQKDKTVNNKITLWLQKEISDFSYGIYLVHIIIIGVLYNLKFYKTFPNPLVSIPLIFSITLLASYIIILMLRKIPGGKYISG